MNHALAVVVAVFGVGAGCATAPQPPSAPRTVAAGDSSLHERPAGEQSVRPGVNERYYDDELGVWIDRLERPKREVVAHRDEIVAALPITSGMRVADVGAGTGLFVEALAQRVGPEGEVVALDIVPNFLARLREIAQTRDNVRVQEGQLRSAGLEAEAFDLVFMCAVYHHLEYPKTYMRSLRQGLAPRGKLVLIDFERIEGKTSERMLKHVRADKATVIGELAEVGFVVTSEIRMMEENYFLVLEAR